MKFIKVFPAGIYNGFIWFLSSAPIFINISGFDKTAHIIEYSILGFLLSFGFSISANNYNTKARYSIVFGAVLGAIDEIHQYYVPGRTMDIIDMFADITGIAMGILIWIIFVKIFSAIKTCCFKNEYPG